MIRHHDTIVQKDVRGDRERKAMGEKKKKEKKGKKKVLPRAGICKKAMARPWAGCRGLWVVDTGPWADDRGRETWGHGAGDRGQETWLSSILSSSCN